MPTINQLNTNLGAARDAVFEKMNELLTSDDMNVGDKSAALLKGQAALSIDDGVQNLLGKAYDNWGRIGN